MRALAHERLIKVYELDLLYVLKNIENFKKEDVEQTYNNVEDYLIPWIKDQEDQHKEWEDKQKFERAVDEFRELQAEMEQLNAGQK